MANCTPLLCAMAAGCPPENAEHGAPQSACAWWARGRNLHLPLMSSGYFGMYNALWNLGDDLFPIGWQTLQVGAHEVGRFYATYVESGFV